MKNGAQAPPRGWRSSPLQSGHTASYEVLALLPRCLSPPEALEVTHSQAWLSSAAAQPRQLPTRGWKRREGREAAALPGQPSLAGHREKVPQLAEVPVSGPNKQREWRAGEGAAQMDPAWLPRIFLWVGGDKTRRDTVRALSADANTRPALPLPTRCWSLSLANASALHSQFPVGHKGNIYQL